MEIKMIKNIPVYYNKIKGSHFEIGKRIAEILKNYPGYVKFMVKKKRFFR